MKERGQIDQQMKNLMTLKEVVAFAGKETLRHSACRENRAGYVEETHERKVDERWGCEEREKERKSINEI